MYSVINIAKYVIQTSCEINSPINNIELQKILYIIQKEYLNLGYENGLFQEDFIACSIGPIVLPVYNRFCGFGSMKILIGKYFNIRLEDNDEIIITEIVKNMVSHRSSQVSLFHKIMQDNRAWKITYRDGDGDYQIIDKTLIKEKG